MYSTIIDSTTNIFILLLNLLKSPNFGRKPANYARFVYIIDNHKPHVMILPYMLANKSRNFGQNLANVSSIRLRRGSQIWSRET